MVVVRWKASSIQPMPLALLMSPSKRRKVFTQVLVDLDLSIFGERLELVRELESNNKSLHFSLWPDGRLHVEGSFAAIKELRKDLQRRVGEPQELRLQSSMLTSGVNASEKKLVKPASNVATQMTEPQKLAASPSYGVNYTLHPGVFEEETTIILDADIFMYIKEFCQEQCEEILQKNYVRAVVTNSDCITVLQLEKASDRCEPSQLMAAKFGIEMIIRQMQQSLVSEKIRLDGGRGQNKTLEICEETVKRFPEVLFGSTDEYFTLIGNSNHCSLFKKEVEEKVKAVQLVFDPAFSGHSVNLNATGHSYHFDQSLGSNTVHGCCEPNTSEYILNRESHSGQYTKSQADCLQTSYSRSDS
ncbi:RNA-binding protein 43-like isoform X2 [Heterodontus francisci]|uniref:RNA-binding protein 43-like isoform X2 n=1 Tax=Heterodontus francisci TaxID=7792 RepID=UPI00355B5353